MPAPSTYDQHKAAVSHTRFTREPTPGAEMKLWRLTAETALFLLLVGLMFGAAVELGL